MNFHVDLEYMSETATDYLLCRVKPKVVSFTGMTCAKQNITKVSCTPSRQNSTEGCFIPMNFYGGGRGGVRV
jgi:hypothetical protein